MRYRQVLYAIIAAGIILNIGVERTNLFAPQDEFLEAVGFFLMFLTLALLFANERKNGV